MFENSNKEVITRLAKRSLNKNRTRNRFAILAIILTSILFTTILTLGQSFKKSHDLEPFRQHGTTAHGVITNVNEEQINKIKNNSLVKSVGTSASMAGKLINKNLGDADVGLMYFDNTALSMKVYDNFEGSMPSRKNEIALPTWVLDKMQLPHKLNQKIHFGYFTADNKKHETDFILTGYYTEYTNIISGDKGVGMIAKSFSDTISTKNVLYVMLKDKKDILSNLRRVANDAGISSKFVSENPSYNERSGNDILDLLPYAVIILIVMSCGYLIIYNIFYISVTQDIRFYGLLKTIGTTPKQIKKIILKQALMLSIYGIPIGIIIGYCISFIFVPLALKGFNISKVDISYNIIIFIGAALFELLTVIAACKKPGKLASKITPIEALKYFRADKSFHKKARRSTDGGKIYRMAFTNVFRDKKRTIVVLLSVTLGFTCFITAATLSKAMDADAFIKRYVPVDFKLTNEPLKQADSNKGINDFLNEKVYSKLQNMKEVKDINRVEIKIFASLPCEGVIRENAVAAQKHTPLYKKGEKVTLPKNYEVETNIFGVTEDIFDDIKKEDITEGKIDKEKLKSGKYAVLSYVYDNKIKVGDKINIGTAERPEEVEVMAIISKGTSFYYPSLSLGPNVYIDENKLKNIYNDVKTLSITFNVKKNTDKEVYSKLHEMLGNSSNINIDTKFQQKESYIEANKALYVTAAGISIIIAFIGVLNFINTMLTSINSRKIEFAMLEAVGMTKLQLKKMLTFEGMYYGIISMLLVGTFGNIVAYYAFNAFKLQVDYAIYRFPGLELLISLLSVTMLSIIMPIIVFKISSKQSVIEVLREN